MDLFDADGNKVEALTPEEAQTMADEAAAKAVEGLSTERQEELDKAYDDIKALEDAKTDLETKLAGEGDKDKNFGAARKKIEDKEKEISELKKTIEGIKGGLEKRIDDITNTQAKQTLAQRILEAVGGNKELAAKVELTYGKFAPASTPEGVTENIQNAILIASGGKAPKIITSRIIGADGGASIKPLNAGKLSEGADQVARNMGLTDQDLKKHNLI